MDLERLKSHELYGQSKATPSGRKPLSPRELLSDQLREIAFAGDQRKAKSPLADVAMMGVAYHNSDLNGEEREIIETAFKLGLLRVICATSTLAAGVNLPARRVIMFNDYRGMAKEGGWLDSATYQQMAGRAGRAGLDATGESVIFARDERRFEAIKTLVHAAPNTLTSCLSNSSTDVRPWPAYCAHRSA